MARARGIINLEDAYQQAFRIPHGPMQCVVAQPSVMSPACVLSLAVPGSQFAPSVYGSILSPLTLAHAHLSGLRVVPTGYSAASGAPPLRSQAEDPDSNSSPTRNKCRGQNSNKGDSSKKPRKTYEPKFTNYTGLIDSRENVYRATCNLVNYRKPPKAPSGNRCPRNSDKKCEFHGDVGHTTNECFQLKDEIKSLFRAGHLGQWVRIPIIYPE